MFITLESTEGGGKGSIAPLIRQAIELSGKNCVHTRQPGGTRVGESIRELFLWKGHFSVKEEVYLLAVDRKRCWEEVIEPALNKGEVVVCERWNATTVAYQAWGRMPEGPVMRDQMETFIRQTLHSLGLVDVRPNLSIHLSMPAQIGLGRIAAREQLDRLELEGLKFMKKAQDGLSHHHRLKTKWLMDDAETIDATKSFREMLVQTLDMLEQRNIITLQAKCFVLAQHLEQERVFP